MCSEIMFICNSIKIFIWITMLRFETGHDHVLREGSGRPVLPHRGSERGLFLLW